MRSRSRCWCGVFGLLVLATAVLLAFPSRAAGAVLTGNAAPTLMVRPDPVPAGAEITILGERLPSGLLTVEIKDSTGKVVKRIKDEPVAKGTLSIKTKAPVVAGRYTVSIVGVKATASFTVELAESGRASRPLAAVGFGLVAAGLALQAGLRARRPRA